MHKRGGLLVLAVAVAVLLSVLLDSSTVLAQNTGDPCSYISSPTVCSYGTYTCSGWGPFRNCDCDVIISDQTCSPRLGTQGCSGAKYYGNTFDTNQRNNEVTCESTGCNYNVFVDCSTHNGCKSDNTYKTYTCNAAELSLCSVAGTSCRDTCCPSGQTCQGTPATCQSPPPPRCNDDDGDSYPTNPIECESTRSQDCNDNPTTGGSVWQLLTGYADNDGDGYGAGTAVDVCSGAALPSGYSASDTDCNDAPSAGVSIHPGATEVCNGVDDDCDTLVDEGVKNVCLSCGTVTNSASWGTSCSAGTGICEVDGSYVCNLAKTAVICNADANTDAATTETCNGEDDDCDGRVDEGLNCCNWNGRADSGEECDLGPAKVILDGLEGHQATAYCLTYGNFQYIDCTSSCTSRSYTCPRCGDGTVQSPEVCEVGQTNNLRCADGSTVTQTCGSTASPTPCQWVGSCPSAPVAACSDGVQNGDETGKDCGGSCPAPDCLKTQGVCAGLKQKCGAAGWTMCVNSDYLTHNSAYETAEATCNDGLDNNCNGYADFVDSGCSAPPPQTCTDGTAVNTCSSTKPVYCLSNQQLTNNCATCGCPASTPQCNSGGYCEAPSTPDPCNWMDPTETTATCCLRSASAQWVPSGEVAKPDQVVTATWDLGSLPFSNFPNCRVSPVMDPSTGYVYPWTISPCNAACGSGACKLFYFASQNQWDCGQASFNIAKAGTYNIWVKAHASTSGTNDRAVKIKFDVGSSRVIEYVAGSNLDGRKTAGGSTWEKIGRKTLNSGSHRLSIVAAASSPADDQQWAMPIGMILTTDSTPQTSCPTPAQLNPVRTTASATVVDSQFDDIEGERVASASNLLVPAGNFVCKGDFLNPDFFVRTKDCVSGACQSNPSDKALCDKPSDCVFNGRCYSDISLVASNFFSGNEAAALTSVWSAEVSADVNGNGRPLVCDPGQWMSSQGTLVGNITDDSELHIPLGGVSISAVGASNPALTYSTTTQADGTYTITDVTPANYDITASKAGYSSDERSNYPVPAMEVTGVNFTLLSGATLTGIVTNISDLPVKNAIVKIIGTALSAVTDDAGAYTILNVPAGTYDLAASKPSDGYADKTVFKHTISGTDTVNFQLLRTLGNCKDDCTTTTSNSCEASCNGKGKCWFYSDETMEACDGTFGLTQLIGGKAVNCCTGNPYAQIKADVTVKARQVAKSEELVMYSGKLLKMVTLLFIPE